MKYASIVFVLLLASCAGLVPPVECTCAVDCSSEGATPQGLMLPLTTGDEEGARYYRMECTEEGTCYDNLTGWSKVKKN